MSTVAVGLAIDAPLERVWDTATDLCSRAGWLSGVQAVDLLTDGPFGVGSRWRETRAIPRGTAVTEEFQVVECTPQQRYVVSSPGSGARYRITYTFRPIRSGRHRGGTLVGVEQLGTPVGARGRVLEVVLGGLAARTVEAALRDELDDLAAAVRQADTSVA